MRCEEVIWIQCVVGVSRKLSSPDQQSLDGGSVRFDENLQ